MSIWANPLGVYLIAEIGGNHEGDFNKAKELVELACTTGVDAVKFQIYTADSLVNKVEDPGRNAHFKKFELTPEQHIALAKICQSNKVTYSASIWDIDAIEWIDPYMEFYKVGSGDLTAYPFLERIAIIGKPIIISTGLAKLEEVKESVEFLREKNNIYRKSDYLALLQCTSSYPLPESDVNLRVIKTFKDKFDVTVGYSDHTIDSFAAEVAVSIGAEILEIHFTDDKHRKTFRDHQISFTVEEIEDLIDKIKRIKILQGSPTKSPTESETDPGQVNSFRRGIYATHDIPKGKIISKNDLIVLRPNHGLDARLFKKIIGKKIKKNVNHYDRFNEDMFN